MTICVDKLIKQGNKWWCHLASDLMGPEGLEELHAFAARIGCKREWFQPRPSLPHYDLQPRLRQKAVNIGAVEVDGPELVARCSLNLRFRRPPK